MRLRFSLVGVLIVMLFSSNAILAQAETHAEYVRSNYVKYEYYIPMRDGVRLFTSVYLPVDQSDKYPILMVRTPYTVRPYGIDKYKTLLGPTEAFDRQGFIFVFQDVRGKYMSEGEFVNMRPHNPNKKSTKDIDESTDTYDTIEWLINNIPNNNGNVGQWGISYPGFYSSAGMIDSHPALKAVSPQAPISDWFWDDMHHHGAFVLPLGFNFFSSFGQARPEPTTEGGKRFDHGTADGYQFFLELGPLKNANEKYFKGEIDFWNKMTEHPNYDAFWQSRNILPHLKNVNAAVMIVGGWFDTEDLYGPLKTYRSVEEKNPDTFNILVMGPWYHGGWRRSDGDRLGDANFGFKTSEYFRENHQLKFFNHYLHNDSGDVDLPEATVFETGANRWRSFDAWPPVDVEKKKLFLHDDGKLAFDADQSAGTDYDEYISDPAKPVPYTKQITTGWARNYMTEDQRFAARRPDVLVYRSEVLEEDLTFAGPIMANLFVATSGTDSDWVVKIIDVNPDKIEIDGEERGAQQTLVRWEVLRGRFRESYENPKPFVANEVTPISLELQDVLHTFKRGHQIMIHIQSTFFPFIDRNPQKYVPNIFKADESDFITVMNRVYRSETYPSHLEVGLLP